ncbi:hypothetical protein BRM3_14990 (plasmid) [Brachybacterium huguangmaarense]|uniref:Uncharacterized protein n=1 Tax=Brachybacterium huguangmaarense TaxID=1652028 RepID=A0ABY6G505_9MICO|nr:hypothetical protein [Brachybacterium huguangmaarense]UYG18306.1 hypothetical protein BRM3_14990 [Brachybacterium huguangmaarense]
MFTGAELKDWVLIVAGNIFIVILVVRAISHYAKREWGELITNLLIAVFIAWIVYSNSTFIAFLRWAAEKITGGQSASASGMDGAHTGVQALADSAPHVMALLAAGVI